MWELIQSIDTSATELGGDEVRLAMDEQEFQLFYTQTFRSLRAYLRRATRDNTTADDLLQEAYYRFLRAEPLLRDDTKRTGYLFQIATNLVRDHFRAAKRDIEFEAKVRKPQTVDPATGLRRDVDEALELLKPKQRTMLWLAYVNGSSHQEIAAATGLKEASVRPLLLRARRKLAAVLRKRGISLEALSRARK